MFYGNYAEFSLLLLEKMRIIVPESYFLILEKNEDKKVLNFQKNETPLVSIFAN